MLTFMLHIAIILVAAVALLKVWLSTHHCRLLAYMRVRILDQTSMPF